MENLFILTTADPSEFFIKWISLSIALIFISQLQLGYVDSIKQAYGRCNDYFALGYYRKAFFSVISLMLYVIYLHAVVLFYIVFVCLMMNIDILHIWLNLGYNEIWVAVVFLTLVVFFLPSVIRKFL